MPQSYAAELEQEKTNGGRRTPGRPRSEDARRAILRSTLRLLQETGFPDLSIEAIAADADVGKATVYRWWPNKAALVADAFSSSADEAPRSRPPRTTWANCGRADRRRPIRSRIDTSLPRSLHDASAPGSLRNPPPRNLARRTAL